MNVSSRNMLAGAAIAALTCVAAVTANHAMAQVGSATPNVTVPGGQETNPCCNIPRNQIINVPGARTGGSHIVVNSSNSQYNSTTVLEGGQTSSQGSTFVYFGGRSGGNYNQQIQSSILNDLNVVGTETVTQTVVENVPVTESYCEPTAPELVAMPVQALCVDDRGAPHPASQTFEEADVDQDYSGEIFRCVAGSYMQVTVGAFDAGEPVYDGGRTFSCKKGEALFHAPGGELTCGPEAPRRNCNERSLLRRYGPGVKAIKIEQPACIPTERTVIQQVSREVQVEKEITDTGRLILDGGVGVNVH